MIKEETGARAKKRLLFLLELDCPRAPPLAFSQVLKTSFCHVILSSYPLLNHSGRMQRRIQKALQSLEVAGLFCSTPSQDKIILWTSQKINLIEQRKKSKYFSPWPQSQQLLSCEPQSRGMAATTPLWVPWSAPAPAVTIGNGCCEGCASPATEEKGGNVCCLKADEDSGMQNPVQNALLLSFNYFNIGALTDITARKRANALCTLKKVDFSSSPVARGLWS